MAELLAVDAVTAGYGDGIVLEDVSLALEEGDTLALLGRNGMGKTTLLITLMGLTRLRSGTLRWRGGELIMHIGGPAIVPEFLRKLPTGRDTEYLPEEIGGYGDRISEMNPVPLEAVRSALTAESWVARLIAVQVIGRRGGREDVPTVQQLTSDNTRITGDGWDDGATVGKEARTALARLQGGPGGAP